MRIRRRRIGIVRNGRLNAAVVRYLAPSAVIVVAILAVILAISHREPRPPLAPRYAGSSASPGIGPRDPTVRTAEPVSGEAPWALSAVPECFRERVTFTGTAAFVRAHLPAGARPLRGPYWLAAADCVVVVRGGTIELDRGDDHLVVPPPATLYRTPAGVALWERAGARERLRVYALVR